MRFLLLAAFLLAAACEPPPPLAGGDPTLMIVFPPPDPTICLEADGSLNLLAVVRIDNLELAPFGEPTEGEGHWHLTLNDDYEATPELYAKYQRDPGTFAEGENVLLKADLVGNDHIALDNAANDVREFQIEPFGTKNCDNSF